MDEALKARLIGAAVLVALAVLLIPELLSGRGPAGSDGRQRRRPRAARAPSPSNWVGARPPRLRSRRRSRFQASPRPGRRPRPRAICAGRAAARAPGPTQVRPAAPRPPWPPPALQPRSRRPRPARASPPPICRQRPDRHPRQRIRSPLRHRFHSPPPPTARLGAAGRSRSAPSDRWPRRRKWSTQLKSAGYRAYVSPVSRSGKTLHRVRVGPEAERGRAEGLAASLKARGLPATVVAND